MTKYLLMFNEGGIYTVEVDAENEEDAWEKGYHITSGQEPKTRFRRMDLNPFDIFHVHELREEQEHDEA